MRNQKQEKAKDFTGTLLRIFKSLNRWKYILVIACVLSFIAAMLSAVAPNKLADVTDVISDGIKPNTENIELVATEINKSIIENYSIYKLKNNNNEIFEADASELFLEFMSLTKNEKELILKPMIIKDKNITVSDQLVYLDAMSGLSKDSDPEELLTKLDELPASIKSLVEPKLDMDKLYVAALIVGVIYLLNSLFVYIEGILMAYVGIGYSKRLRNGISKKINVLPLRYFDNHETGDVLSRVTNDVDTIGINMSNTITSLVTNVTLFLGSIIMMFITNYIMAFTAIAASILGFIGSFIILKKSQKYFIMRQKELGDLNGHIEEIYSGHNVVKAYNGEESALQEFDRINENLYTCNRKSQFLSGIMQPVMGFVGNFGYVAVCVVGALLVMNNQTTFGTIVAFMIYIRLFTNPLTRIAQAMTTMQSVAAAAERVYEFMDEEELADESNLKEKVNKKDAKGNIEFKNVKFSYDDKRTIIEDFSAKVKSGEKIAIVGPTGAGKTTMVNLLMKFYDIKEGDILIDGKSIKELTRENIHDLFIMVLQDTWLFEGTIRENLVFNKKHISDEHIWDICKTVGVDHFIKTLPGGLDSTIGENDSVSSGQKQLLTIARGMIEDEPFLILDEATSNVDTRTEELVQKAMDKLTEGRTSFIIAHRLSTIKNANLILVMNEGNIVEQGTHEELLKKNGFYAKLYNSQFQK
ncbi:MAG: ABC transporter ATP-binding protein [Bacilli bacterium]|nr:ABC transporter ATP-binding protein [Bacilli bacterium]MBR6137121.1 ABC transporter ATP-binding protein [Bacilli bacterium]MBR6949637.1 ABC transporter ATP-binding protein [Bacilli bacterium]